MAMNRMPLSAASSIALQSPVADPGKLMMTLQPCAICERNCESSTLMSPFEFVTMTSGLASPCLASCVTPFLTSSSRAARQELPR